MATYLSPQQGIIELVSKLENELAAFANMMLNNPERMRIDAAYHIPYRFQAEVDDWKEIEVTPLEGHAAIRQVVDGLTAIRIEPGKQNPRETLRAPGAIAMPKPWIEQLVELNRLKSEIEGLVGRIPDQVERMRLWGSMKYLSSLQTMRHAWIVDSPKKIRFYWDAVPSVKPSTAAGLIASYTKHLMDYFGHVPTFGELDQSDRNIKYLYGIQALSELPGEERVAVFREGKPHVRARISFLDKLPAVIRPAPTPIIYETGDPVPSIAPLISWEPTQRQGQRSNRAKIEAEPLVESLYLYRYLAPYRFTK